MGERITISEAYRTQQIELHQNPNYGIASLGVAPIVRDMITARNIKSICDYGAGKQNLKKWLDQNGVRGFQYFPYDPAFPEYGPPRRAELVCCIDVLEHIEPDFVEPVIGELADITVRIGFFTIATEPANKVLSDGRNAHLIQKPAAWWLPLLSKRFEVLNLWRNQSTILMTVEPAKSL
jgi:hypothetical protein